MTIENRARLQLAALFHVYPPPSNISLDWATLIRVAAAESLLPALWQRVQILGLGATVDSETADVLQAAESLNGERNQQILAEATHVAALLNSAGIEPVALKGLAYLFSGVYPKPATRYLQDIDLLIPEPQLASARMILMRNGFEAGASDPLTPLRHHGPLLQRPYGPPVELHRSLGLGVCKRLLPACEVIRDSRVFLYNGAYFRIPSTTHLASHLILHSQLHSSYRETIYPPLRSLYELQMLGETLPVDWKGLVDRYTEKGQYLTLALHFKEAARILGVKARFAERLGVLGQIRWQHRLLLTSHSKVRFVDPVYLLFFVFARRIKMLRQVALQPKHWLSLVRACLSAGYYRNLFRI